MSRPREAIARGAAPPGRAVWIDGTLRRGAEAVLSVFDRGARDGEGLFETLRVRNGRPFQWERHLERLVLSAAELGFPVPPSAQALGAGLDAVLEAEGLREAVVRITVTRGLPGGRPTRAGCWIEAEPIEGRLWRGTLRHGAEVILSRRPFAPGLLGAYKTTSRLAYSLAREEARAAAADEVLLLSGEGEVIEGAVSNVFAVLGAEVATPPRSSGLLPGITRDFVLAQCALLGIRVRAAALWRDELSLAREVFLTNSVQGIVPVATLEGRPLPERAFAALIGEAYAKAVAAETR